MARLLISNLLGLVGAIIGGVLGFYTFAWLRTKGSMGWRSPGPSWDWAAGCSRVTTRPFAGCSAGVAALGLSLFTEWKFHPFLADRQFLLPGQSPVGIERPVTLLMIVLGTVIAFWVGKDGGFGSLAGRARREPPAPEPTKDRVEEV